MDIQWDTQENKQLIQALLSLENAKEAKQFLRDLMTQGEVAEFGRRLEAARLLSRNTDYKTISKKTGLSSTTIARISKWLKGPSGGYALILKRIVRKHA